MENKEKKSKGKVRRTIGIVLLVMQAISLFGTISNGEIGMLFSRGFAYLAGYFLPTIIAIILLNSAAKANNSENE